MLNKISTLMGSAYIYIYLRILTKVVGIGYIFISGLVLWGMARPIATAIATASLKLKEH